MDLLLEPHYLPCIRYISKFWLYDRIVIDDVSPFQKQSYRNRCTIASANGPINLIIPVHDSRGRLPEKEMRIDNHGDWQRQHWQSIRSAYGRTPFFEHYHFLLGGSYQKPFVWLFDFKIELMHTLLKILKIDPARMVMASGLDNKILREMPKPDIEPKPRFHIPDLKFTNITYFQAFSLKHGFLPNLSVIDLIFNQGPAAVKILKESAKDRELEPGEVIIPAKYRSGGEPAG
jgi:hypothetical protein